MIYTIKEFDEIAPIKDVDYFTALSCRSSDMEHHDKKRTVSIGIPCYNEEGEELKRTIDSLLAQKVSDDFSIELFIAIDGVKRMSKSMKVFLCELFGDKSNEISESIDSFSTSESEKVMIVEQTYCPFDDDNCRVSSVCLLLKGINKKKVNSQKWWLGCHAKAVRCEFALATDCGIVFDENCVFNLLKRMDTDLSLLAISGFQTGQTSEIQGEGKDEWYTDPWGYLLRQIQRFDIEVAEARKSFQDSSGFVIVLPGPCQLFRYKHLGTLEEGVMNSYFQILSKNVSKGMISVGNIQLAEDRFISALLTFQSKRVCKERRITMPRTGHCPDAVFHFDMEKPLAQFVKQRRRWSNAQIVVALWVLKSGRIFHSDHRTWEKIASVVTLLCEIITDLIAKFAGVGMYTASVYATLFFHFNASQITAIIMATAYFLLFVVFLGFHAPRATQVELESGEKAWINDKKTVYNRRIFGTVVTVNYILMVFILSTYLKAIITGENLIILTPLVVFSFNYVVAIFDGLVRCETPNLRAFKTQLITTPFYYLSSIWATVWFQSYATVRISDFTWGNRPGSRADLMTSDVAHYNAKVGKIMFMALIISNGLAAMVFLYAFSLKGASQHQIVFMATNYGSFVNALPNILCFTDLVMRLFYRITMVGHDWLKSKEQIVFGRHWSVIDMK